MNRPKTSQVRDFEARTATALGLGYSPQDQGVTVRPASSSLFCISSADRYKTIEDRRNTPTSPYRFTITKNESLLNGFMSRLALTEVKFSWGIANVLVSAGTNTIQITSGPTTDVITLPEGFYSITKHTAEQLVESYCKTFGIKYKIIRLGNVVGKSDNKVSKKKNALQFLLNEIKSNNKINLYNEGQFYRDYIDVEDVVDVIKFIIDNGENSEVYNLASGVPVLFKDIIDYAYNQLNSTSEIGVMEPTDFHKLVQVESMYLDTTKLNNLGFKPSKNIYQIIDNLIK